MPLFFKGMFQRHALAVEWPGSAVESVNSMAARMEVVWSEEVKRRNGKGCRDFQVRASKDVSRHAKGPDVVVIVLGVISCRMTGRDYSQSAGSLSTHPATIGPVSKPPHSQVSEYD